MRSPYKGSDTRLPKRDPAKIVIKGFYEPCKIEYIILFSRDLLFQSMFLWHKCSITIIYESHLMDKFEMNHDYIIKKSSPRTER